MFQKDLPDPSEDETVIHPGFLLVYTESVTSLGHCLERACCFSFEHNHVAFEKLSLTVLSFEWCCIGLGAAGLELLISTEPAALQCPRCKKVGVQNEYLCKHVSPSSLYCS